MTLLSCPFACAGTLNDGTLCPGTLEIQGPGRLEQLGGELAAQKWARPGCPREVVTTIRSNPQHTEEA